jgi:gamma-glutamyltranspeptidase/glutathione hydrolase
VDARKDRRVDDNSLDLLSETGLKPQRVAVSPHGMIAAQHFLATEAGAKILKKGGNAVDAAVTAALALGVCEPAASGLGGQTFMLIYDSKNRKTIALDGSSRAPHRAIPGSISPEECRRGYKASTVPSTPGTLGYALERYGTVEWKTAIQPAIRLAEDGYEISELQRRLTKKVRKILKEQGGGQFFLKDNRKTYRVGERFRQPVLAQTLIRLKKKGVDDFFHGRIARHIHRDMVRNGGLIRRDDLAQMMGPIERKPVSCRFGDKRVVTFPPPGAGRTLIEMLNIISHFPVKRRNFDTPEGAVLLAGVIRQAFRDRRDRPYDPSFYAQVSDRKMTSLDYAAEIARRVKSGGDTTHLSVMDKYGNAVALTQSIERVYGSCAAAPELGFLYNNYMTEFEYEDIKHPYYMRPSAVPWASVAPTIVFSDRKPWLAIGSPGSERITSSIFQVLLRLNRQSAFQAVDAPRLHCSLDGKVSIEASRMRDDIPAALENRGFEVDFRNPYSFYLGSVQLVMRDGDQFIGVADPRRDGSAKGPTA